MSRPVQRQYIERPTGPQEYYDTSDSDYSDYENMPADHINDYPVDHQEGVEGSLHDIEQGGVEDVIDTKAEEIYPIQLYFEDVRYAVPIQKKKKKTNEQGGGFFRRKKKTTNMETTDQKVVQEAHQQPAIQPPTDQPIHAEPPAGKEDKKGKKHKKEKKKDKQKKNVEYRYLLKGITGVVNPGTLLAIMGSSGAGKTTLLNVLAGRKDKGSILEGKILLNGNEWDKAKPIRKHIAYIMQDDILMKTQTPKEIFMFSAKLKIPVSVMKTNEERQQRVDHLINQLGLQRSQNTQVGAAGEKRGISGGERKRVSIGHELVGNPSLLFVDEPTSGLDTFTAESVMKVLRDLAKGGRTVVTTIHQPNSYIFGLFDQLMLMSAGEVVYYGPANQAHVYFSRLGYELPLRVNPADFFVKLIHVDPLNEESKIRNAALIQSYKDSDLFQKLRSEMVVNEVPIVQDEKEKKSKRDYARGPGAQIGILLKRSFQDVYREPLKIRASLISNVIIALLIGLIFLQIGSTQADIQSKLGALFFIVLNQTFSSVTGIVNLFPAEKSLFLREHGNNMYRTTAFYFAKIIADLPMQIASPLLFGTIAYFMIGFKTNGVNFLLYIIVVILVANIGSALGLTLGIVAKDAGTASALIPMIVLPFVIFSGFFVNSKTVPKYFIWVPPISFVKYAFSAVVVNEFTGLHFHCTSSELIRAPSGETVCPVTTGEQELRILDFYGDSIAVDIVVLAAYYVGLRILGWFALLWRARQVANA